MQLSTEELFCDTCQRNQALLTRLLSEYLPEEDDPQYEQYVAAYDEYKVELEERYPQVCASCLPRVQGQIRNAGYVAKADHLRRIMEKSEQRRATLQSSRQAWTLRIISLAKWAYIGSTIIGSLWHIFALLMAPNEGIWADETFRWNVCLSQVLKTLSVDESCVRSPYIVRLLQYTISVDLATIWWNPALRVKTTSLTGRMSGLKSLWFMRATTILLRFAVLHYWQGASIDYDTFRSFQNSQIFMLVVLALSFTLTWKTVRIVYQSPASFPQLAHEVLPSTPRSAEKAFHETHYTAHPQPNIFDGMAHSFASGIQDDSSALPPSPTLTDSSYTTYNTEATTPFAQRNSFLTDDAMDWTPTRRRFAAEPPEVLPNQWSHRDNTQPPSPPPQPIHREPHSIFNRPDPNPFRHKVPAAPRAPAQAQANPWKPGVWDPLQKSATSNFFKTEKNARGDVGEAKGLDGLGVPRNVKRDAELFASPKLKYDYYGTMKDTGLEDTFNELFSK